MYFYANIVILLWNSKQYVHLQLKCLNQKQNILNKFHTIQLKQKKYQNLDCYILFCLYKKRENKTSIVK